MSEKAAMRYLGASSRQHARNPRVSNYLLLAAGATVLLFLCIVGGLMILQGRYGMKYDEGWIDEERHTLEPFVKPTVPDNGFYTYQEAIALSTLSDAHESREAHEATIEEYRRGGATLTEVRPILSANEAALAKLREAADKDYVSPAEPDPNFAFAFLAKYRSLARLLAARIKAQHKMGQDALALQSARDAYALAVNCPRYGAMIESLVGTACAAIVSPDSIRVLTGSHLPASECRRHALYMRKLRERLYPFSGTLRFESLFMEHCVDLMDKGGPEAFAGLVGGGRSDLEQQLHVRVFFMFWNRDDVMEWYEDRFARMMAEGDMPFGQSDLGMTSGRTEADIEARNDILGEVLFPILPQAHSKWLVLNGYLIAEDAAACLAAFHADHGYYPKDLSELVPDYMPELPPDPFTGKPLQYKRADDGYLLYSIGPDKIDNGGSWERASGAYRRKDVVFAPPRFETEPGGPMH